MGRKQEATNPYKLPVGVEMGALLTGENPLTSEQQKAAARFRRQQVKINKARTAQPASERLSSGVAARIARPVLRRLEAGADKHAARAQGRAEAAAKRHYETNREAYQTHALIDDNQKTVIKEKIKELEEASPMDMAAIAISQGRGPREVATIWQHTNERQAAKASGKVEKEKGISALEKVPGIDPVLALVDGHAEDIPKSGWLVNSHIAPGYGGKIDIYRYEEGQLDFKPADDNREKYGEVRVHFGIKGGDSHTIAYENPAFPNPTTEPYDRMSPTSYTGLSFGSTDIISLSNGGRLLDEKKAMGSHPNGINLFTSMDWREFDDSMREHSSDFPVNRVTADQSELTSILSGLGEGMGLGSQDIQTMLGTIDQKINPDQQLAA